MTTETPVDILCDLSQAEIDTVNTYLALMRHVDGKEVKLTLEEFRQRHMMHVQALNQMVLKFGGRPPVLIKDFRYLGAELVSALRSISDSRAALKAMDATESRLEQKYAAAIGGLVDGPAGLLPLFRKQNTEVARFRQYVRATMQKLT